MRSISVKITLVLVVISLIGALFTSFYIQNRTQKAFDSFIRDQDQQVLVEALTDHYLVNGNWENAQAVFQKVYPFISRNNPGENAGGNSPGANTPFILTSPTGEIQDTSPGPGSPKPGISIPLTEAEKGIPIKSK